MNWRDELRRKKAVERILRNGQSKADRMAEFTQPKVVDYPQLGELQARIEALIHEYDGEIALASVLGVLDLVKDSLKGEG